MTPLPPTLKADRNVAPFLARAAELKDANPVVSYYCKVYVLDHILNNKLHQTGSDVEAFTVGLLDETEAMKSADDESVRQVLASKQLSINLVFVFAFKLFHSCLEDLGNYDGSNKVQLAGKLRATINFWTLFSVFAGANEKDPIDFAKTTGGTCNSEDEFFAFTRDKLKTLKYQLSRLIKDEVPIKGEEQELEELAGENEGEEVGEPEVTETGAPEATESERAEITESDAPQLPGVPKDFEETHVDDSAKDSTFELPGAPSFDPSENTDDDIQLPGAPKFLPDDDLSSINKKSSIQVFPPESEPKPQPPAPQRQPSNVTHVTKETLGEIVDTTEQMGKVQKHAKFAISALNYEDIATAESELVKGLELLRLLKERM